VDAGLDGDGVGGGRGVPAGAARDGLDRLVGALDAARGPLGELSATLAAGGEGRAELVVATTATVEVFEAAGRFLEAVAAERREAPAKYRVTCPECGAESMTEWTDVLPPGGVSPVACSACGYMILSESEGDPILVAEGV
jgi:hypothetical protein